MANRKPPLRASRNGQMRRTRRAEIRLTEEEETILELMHDEFVDSSGNPDVTFSDFLAILLRRHIEQEKSELEGAMQSNGLT